MLARIEMKLKSSEGISYQMSSLFHGVLMEQLPEGYAAYLHQSQLHPYAQHLELIDREWYWIVCCFNDEAVSCIIKDVLLELNSIDIKKQNQHIDIVSKNYYEMTYEALMAQFYEGGKNRFVHLQFVTPTAFKQSGRYLFYPDIRCVYQSLMNKYDAVMKEESMVDEETLEQLCQNTQIVHYDLKSVKFHMEGVRIPAFIGNITLKLSGTQTMADFANLLFEFGEYSGVGIKTAIGMGALKIIKKGGRRSDRETD